ncbi:MAG: metal-dependent hydrolase [Gemmatimonadaceae bacterium]
MPSVFTHVVAASALGTAFRNSEPTAPIIVLGALCSIVPDIDLIALGLGIPNEHLFGHRGLTHSFAFAAAVATISVSLLSTFGIAQRFVALWLYFFLATASHGVLDGMTNGGLGIAFFAPFDKARYWMPWRPILASPSDASSFLWAHSTSVIASELLWVWLPALIFVLLVLPFRRDETR